MLSSKATHPSVDHLAPLPRLGWFEFGVAYERGKKPQNSLAFIGLAQGGGAQILFSKKIYLGKIVCFLFSMGVGFLLCWKYFFDNEKFLVHRTVILFGQTKDSGGTLFRGEYYLAKIFVFFLGVTFDHKVHCIYAEHHQNPGWAEFLSQKCAIMCFLPRVRSPF